MQYDSEQVKTVMNYGSFVIAIRQKSSKCHVLITFGSTVRYLGMLLPWLHVTWIGRSKSSNLDLKVTKYGTNPELIYHETKHHNIHYYLFYVNRLAVPSSVKSSFPAPVVTPRRQRRSGIQLPLRYYLLPNSRSCYSNPSNPPPKMQRQRQWIRTKETLC